MGMSVGGEKGEVWKVMMMRKRLGVRGIWKGMEMEK